MSECGCVCMHIIEYSKPRLSPSPPSNYKPTCNGDERSKGDSHDRAEDSEGPNLQGQGLRSVWSCKTQH